MSTIVSTQTADAKIRRLIELYRYIAHREVSAPAGSVMWPARNTWRHQAITVEDHLRKSAMEVTPLIYRNLSLKFTTVRQIDIFLGEVHGFWVSRAREWWTLDVVYKRGEMLSLYPVSCILPNNKQQNKHGSQVRRSGGVVCDVPV